MDKSTKDYSNKYVLIIFTTILLFIVLGLIFPIIHIYTVKIIATLFTLVVLFLIACLLVGIGV